VYLGLCPAPTYSFQDYFLITIMVVHTLFLLCGFVKVVKQSWDIQEIRRRMALMEGGLYHIGRRFSEDNPDDIVLQVLANLRGNMLMDEDSTSSSEFDEDELPPTPPSSPAG
ncbi:hypothetical protein L9F63_003186, partial [Diploptera punctata]